MAEYACPHCKKPVYDDDALLCLYCGESLHRNVGFLGKIKYFNPKAAVIGIVVLILLGFIMLVAR